MDTEIIKYFTVFAWTMVKFIFGPVLSAIFNISFLPSVFLTVGGMMTSVVLFTYAGRAIRQWWLRKFHQNRVLFTPKKRRMVRIWRKYGIWGVAVLTPLIFTPIGGTMIAVSFGEKKHKILLTMLISATFWALVFCSLIVILGKEVFLHLTGH